MCQRQGQDSGLFPPPFSLFSRDQLFHLFALHHWMASYFRQVFGFDEGNYGTTKQTLSDAVQVRQDPMDAKNVVFLQLNGQELQAGTFFNPSVEELRAQLEEQLAGLRAPLREEIVNIQPTLQNVVGESLALHALNPGSVFQAASQFNCLEFATPDVIPEQGITNYVNDRTQGPACAIACAAGAAFRNYLCHVPGAPPRTLGQQQQNQINNLADVEEEIQRLTQQQQNFWTVRNGYVYSTTGQLNALNTLIATDPRIGDIISKKLRIGVQRDTQVTTKRNFGAGERIIVTQTYNSALSCGYAHLPLALWEPLATRVLAASYEATLLVAAINVVRESHRRGSVASPPVFLTKIGGGFFANSPNWIMDAIRAAFQAVCTRVPLQVKVTHFQYIEPCYGALKHP